MALFFQTQADLLSIPISKRVSKFRLAIDTSVFRKRAKAGLKDKWGLEDNDFIVFLPSRIMIRDTPELKKTGQWKASDRAICGFADFLGQLSRRDQKKIKLIIPQRSINSDLDIAKILIEKLKIKKNVIFIQGEKESGLSRDELIDVYSLSDVVLDDFGVGWYGSAVVEALSCGAPVISYVPDEFMRQIVSWHPIINAQYPEDIARCIHKLYSKPELLKRTAKMGVDWINEFHSYHCVRNILHDWLIHVCKK